MYDEEPENNEKVFEDVSAIKLENVDFTAGEHHIFKNISLEFEANKKISCQ